MMSGNPISTKPLIIEARVNEYMMRGDNSNVPYLLLKLPLQPRARERLEPPSCIFMCAAWMVRPHMTSPFMPRPFV